MCYTIYLYYLHWFVTECNWIICNACFAYTILYKLTFDLRVFSTNVWYVLSIWGPLPLIFTNKNKNLKILDLFILSIVSHLDRPGFWLFCRSLRSDLNWTRKIYRKLLAILKNIDVDSLFNLNNNKTYFYYIYIKEYKKCYGRNRRGGCFHPLKMKKIKNNAFSIARNVYLISLLFKEKIKIKFFSPHLKGHKSERTFNEEWAP